jgi:hypothetical protein
VIVTFTAGAVFGAIASRAWNVHAIWCAAAILAVTLVLFVIDGRAAGSPSRRADVGVRPRIAAPRPGSGPRDRLAGAGGGHPLDQRDRQ